MATDLAGAETSGRPGNTVRGTREALPLAWRGLPRSARGTLWETTVRHGCRASERFRVPPQPSHQGGPMGPAEKGEGRERAKGNAVQQTRGRTPRRGVPGTGARRRTAGGGPARHAPRQEPGAGVPHAGIWAGGVG